MQRGVDGANEVRPGTILFAETGTYLDEIINCEYYSGYIIAVGKNGKMVKIDASGNVNVIWDDTWAGNLPGNPSGWITTGFVSFAVFNGDLIVCNGVNKPVIITPSISASYLKDLADDSNANTPIARFVVAHGRYLVMAGSLTAGEEDRLFISNIDSSGTFVGDSGPNDAITVDLGSRVPSGSHAIKGLGKFRDQLMVLFEEAILPGTLGVYSGSDHIPTFDDAFENVGALSHRIAETMGKNMLFGDVNGISLIRRAQFTGGVVTESASELIASEYQKALNNLDSVSALEDKVWSIWDSRHHNYMVFIPNASGDDEITEYRCFVYKNNEQLKVNTWQDWRNWKFRSGCRSALKSIFLTEGTQVFRLGDATPGSKDAVYADYVGDQEMFGDGMSFSDYTGWNPVADEADSGIPIRFIWELPWADHERRFLVKNSRYINFDTLGDNRFTAEMFTDNVYEDKNDFGENWEEDELKFGDELGFDVDVLDPALSMVFQGGDSPGFGADEFGEDFGGGRPTRLENLCAWTAKYKLQKLRFSGEATESLKFVSVSMAYLTGSPRR